MWESKGNKSFKRTGGGVKKGSGVEEKSEKEGWRETAKIAERSRIKFANCRLGHFWIFVGGASGGQRWQP